MPKILPNQTDIYALTDSNLSLGRPVTEVVAALLKAQVKIIQYREKKLKAHDMLRECQEIRAMTSRAGACFIVNDHVDIAMLVDADGVHIGQEDLPLFEVRKLIGPNKIIGLSTHNPNQAKEAIRLGADYIGVGPLFATQTKEDVCDPVGLEYLDFVAKNIDLPFVAIGGIKKHNIGQVVAHGAKCCALVSEIVGAEDIAAQVAEIRAAMK